MVRYLIASTIVKFIKISELFDIIFLDLNNFKSFFDFLGLAKFDAFFNLNRFWP